MFIPTRLFRSNLVPAKPRRAVSSSLGTISLILIAIAVAFLVRQASAAGPQCTAPYVNVQGAGSAATVSELTIQNVNIGEPFDGNCFHKSITFVEKVVTLDPGNSGQVTPLYNGEWTVRFSVPDTAGIPRTLFVVWQTTQVPTGTFSYGFVDTSTAGQNVNRTFICVPPATTCPVTGTVAANGTITITLDTSAPLTFTPQTGSAFSVNLGNPGTNLSSIQGVTYLCACAAGSGVVSTQSQTIGNGSYTLNGNVACSAPPVAALSAVPTMGPAALMVNFDASGSNIPAGGCGTINSYIFDFGDSTGVTQATPTTSHTYTASGTYPARVRVTSTAGLTNANIAQQDITVTGQIQVSSIASRMTHGAAGDFDIILPQPPATRNVECRSGGASNNYKLVFTFVNNLISVASASVTSGAGSVSSSLLGPLSNQYTVNLTGVTNAQSTTVKLNNALDSTGASGNVSAIIGVLVGDTSNDAFVNSADISLTKSKSGQGVDQTNFREDVNADGFLNSADISLTKSKSGTALP
jgi:hypothetical protein